MSTSTGVGALVDPTAFDREPMSLAPRTALTTDHRIGLVDATLNKSSKWGAGMLDAAERVLSAVVSAQIDREQLDPLDVRPADLWAHGVVGRFHAVVLAAGDCITCTSRAARNLVHAERAGVPGAIICTSATTGMVAAVTQSLGLAGLPTFAVHDSFMGRSREEIAALTEPCITELPGALVHQPVVPTNGS